MSEAWLDTIVFLAWLAGASCFVLGLHFMNSPATARNGNRISAAGMTLATFHPFSQTAFFRTYLSAWAWPEIMTALMVTLGLLMMSHILYPVVPKIGFRSRKGLINTAFIFTMIALSVTIPSLYFFPALVGYLTYGILKSVILGTLERLPDDDPMLDEEPDEAGAELREIDYHELSPRRRLFVRRRRPRRASDHIEEE